MIIVSHSRDSHVSHSYDNCVSHSCDNCVSHSQDIRLLLHRYNLLVSDGRLVDYVEAGSELVAFLLRDVHHRSDVKGRIPV